MDIIITVFIEVFQRRLGLFGGHDFIVIKVCEKNKILFYLNVKYFVNKKFVKISKKCYNNLTIVF